MRSDFCVFILTHGRSDRVHTYDTLIRKGYDGKIYFVCDDEDQTLDLYREKFGEDRVLVFDKKDIARRYDEANNFDYRKSIFYARNACFELAREVGVKYFLELDDDYTEFHYRWTDEWLPARGKKITKLTEVFESFVEFLENTPSVHTIAMSQGGDWLGGNYESWIGGFVRLRQKAMNTFFCDVDRQFEFMGAINEDVSSYVTLGRRGLLLFTFNGYEVMQLQTQSNAGGMTDIYERVGTYIKSFYSVMFAPSCVKVGRIGPRNRIHHRISWEHTVPKILREENRRE